MQSLASWTFYILRYRAVPVGCLYRLRRLQNLQDPKAPYDYPNFLSELEIEDQECPA